MLLEARSGGAGSRTRVYIRSCPKHYVRSPPSFLDRLVQRTRFPAIQPPYRSRPLVSGYRWAYLDST